MRIAFMIVLTSGLLCAGCTIRYDATGVSRVGVGLWDFDDPPGVNWNLDWPRRDVPELPASPRPELPPRRAAPQWQSRDMSAHAHIQTPSSDSNSRSGIIATVRRAASPQSLVQWLSAFAIALLSLLAADAIAAEAADSGTVAPTGTAASPVRARTASRSTPRRR
jgi:hypothetical protein